MAGAVTLALHFGERLYESWRLPRVTIACDPPSTLTAGANATCTVGYAVPDGEAPSLLVSKVGNAERVEMLSRDLHAGGEDLPSLPAVPPLGERTRMRWTPPADAPCPEGGVTELQLFLPAAWTRRAPSAYCAHPGACVGRGRQFPDSSFAPAHHTHKRLAQHQIASRAAQRRAPQQRQ